MGRKNIFDILMDQYDLCEEISKIEEVLSFEKILIVDDEKWMNVSDFFDKFALRQWKNRGRIYSYDDFRERLNIEDFIDKATISLEDAFIYFEFVLNVLYSCTVFDEVFLSEEGEFIRNNIRVLIEHFNYEIREFDDEEKVLIVEKNPAATAVSEIVENNVSKAVIEYNHFTMKGKLDEKQKILKLLGDKFEGKQEELKNINSTLEENTRFMLNNVNIRHNNTEGKSKKKAICDMEVNELEKWYDETYQLLLLGFLELDNVERMDKIKQLKKLVKDKEKQE